MATNIETFCKYQTQEIAVSLFCQDWFRRSLQKSSKKALRNSFRQGWPTHDQYHIAAI